MENINKNKYRYPENIDAISGFGADSPYEHACQKMVIAGMEWHDQHPDAHVRFKTSEQIIGVPFEMSADCESITNHMNDAIGGEASGMMVCTTLKHVLAARRIGWDKYLQEIDNDWKEKVVSILKK